MSDICGELVKACGKPGSGGCTVYRPDRESHLSWWVAMFVRMLRVVWTAELNFPHPEVGALLSCCDQSPVVAVGIMVELSFYDFEVIRFQSFE